MALGIGRAGERIIAMRFPVLPAILAGVALVASKRERA